MAAPRTVDFLRTPEAWPAVTAEGSANAAAIVARYLDLSDEEVEDGEYVLFLSGFGLTALPEELGLLGGRVREFCCNDNPLGALSAAIGMLWRLETLSVANCQLAALPAELGNLEWLKNLYCGGNELTDLPALGPRITYIGCENNAMTAVPPAIRACGRLATLKLSNTMIEALPEWLDECSELSWFDVEHCRLATLPASLGNLEVLDALKCAGNPLEEPWAGLVAEGHSRAAIPKRLRADARASAARVKAAR